MNKCLFCGKFVKKNNKFCNRSHAASFNNKRYVKRIRTVWKPCLNCGVSTNNNKYCSLKCQTEFEWKKKKKEIKEKNCVGFGIRTIKKYLIEIRGHFCEICGLSVWRNKPIPLVLDHINGNSYDDRSENIRLVCGNCDMQLSTYKGKNYGKGRYYRRLRYTQGKSF